jgi:predicted ATPase
VTQPDSPLVSNLRISSLKIRNLKAIQSLDLPAQGLGWSERIPDVVLVGGANGSGKTTLLELFAEIFNFLFNTPNRNPPFETDFFPQAINNINLKFNIDVEWVYHTDAGKFSDRSSIELNDDRTVEDKQKIAKLYRQKNNIFLLNKGTLFDLGHQFLHPQRCPSVIVFPSNRNLVVLEESYKMPGPLKDPTESIYIWSPPKVWKDSLEALLYSARWADLSALGAGEPVPGVFDAYADEFHRLMKGKKRLKWSVKGILEVEAENGERHSLDELSSGEKQILVMMTELKRRWRPGSLVLIDEPELHLHETLQTKIYERLVELQKERGGQVWLATQSNHLFKIAAPYTKVLLEPPFAGIGSGRGSL